MNKNEIPTASVGYRLLKGIPEEIKVYKVLKENSEIKEYHDQRKNNALESGKINKNNETITNSHNLNNDTSKEKNNKKNIYIFILILLLIMSYALYYGNNKYYKINLNKNTKNQIQTIKEDNLNKNTKNQIQTIKEDNTLEKKQNYYNLLIRNGLHDLLNTGYINQSEYDELLTEYNNRIFSYTEKLDNIYNDYLSLEEQQKNNHNGINKEEDKYYGLIKEIYDKLHQTGKIQSHEYESLINQVNSLYEANTDPKKMYTDPKKMYTDPREIYNEALEIEKKYQNTEKLNENIENQTQIEKEDNILENKQNFILTHYKLLESGKFDNAMLNYEDNVIKERKIKKDDLKKWYENTNIKISDMKNLGNNEFVFKVSVDSVDGIKNYKTNMILSDNNGNYKISFYEGKTIKE